MLRLKEKFSMGGKTTCDYPRSKSQIIADLKSLDVDASDYDTRAKSIYDECRILLDADRKELSSLMKLPCRLNIKLSDEYLAELADTVDTMKLAAVLVVVSALDAKHRFILPLVISQLQYQADYLRYLGFHECDFPLAFKWTTSDIALSVISEWGVLGMSRKEMIEKSTEGFLELLQIIKRPLLRKFEIPVDANNWFWRYIPIVIQKVSKKLFEDKHYSEAVEAAYKEINMHVKEEYFKRTGREADGADLMRKAFGGNDVVFSLSNSEIAQTRNNEQQGHMELFVGAMLAFRNPKAHANVNIERDEAICQLMLSGLLLTRFDNCR